MGLKAHWYVYFIFTRKKIVFKCEIKKYFWFKYFNLKREDNIFSTRDKKSFEIIF